MAKILIYEKLNDVKTLQKGRGEDGFMRMSGIFGVCGVRNQNNRIYETSNYKAMVDRIKARIVQEGVPGQLEHPSTMNVDLNEVSHVIEDINIDEKGVVTGTIKLLDTPKGKTAQALVEGGLPLFISSRATGTIDKATGKVTLEDLKTYDLVGTPGFSQARLNLAESQYVKDNLGEGCITESIDDNMFIIEAKENTNPATEPNIKENEFNMTDQEHKELLDKIDLMEKKLEQASKAIQEFNSPERMTRIAESIQDWMLNEYSPALQNWVVNEASKNIAQTVTEQLAKPMSEGIQKWMVEEVCPTLQTWIVEHFATENNDKLIKEMSEGIQNWMLQEVAPTITNWVAEEYSPSIDGYIREHLQPALLEHMRQEVANIKESKESKLASVDRLLNMISESAGKPIIGGQITEHQVNPNEPLYLREMPDNMRPLYESASEETKNFIQRKARLFKFDNPAAIERFWESIDWNKKVASTSVLESGQVENEDIRMSKLREQLMRHRIGGPATKPNA